MALLSSRLSLILRLTVAFYTALAAAAAGDQKPLITEPTRGYKVGERIPVTCLNRTMYACSSREARDKHSV